MNYFASFYQHFFRLKSDISKNQSRIFRNLYTKLTIHIGHHTESRQILYCNISTNKWLFINISNGPRYFYSLFLCIGSADTHYHQQEQKKYFLHIVYVFIVLFSSQITNAVVSIINDIVCLFFRIIGASAWPVETGFVQGLSINISYVAIIYGVIASSGNDRADSIRSNFPHTMSYLVYKTEIVHISIRSAFIFGVLGKVTSPRTSETGHRPTLHTHEQKKRHAAGA